MELHEIPDDLRTDDDRAAGARTLAVLAVAVVALAISCVALMIVEWTPPREAPAPGATGSAAQLNHHSKRQ
jgi:hypothetical protein